MSSSEPLLEARSISKSFGVVRALDDVTVAFAPGEIHAVLGENGAGKSTLMGVLAGFVVPDAGATFLNGEALPLGKPFDCKRLGVGMIHQHFTLVPAFSVAENLALAQLDSLWKPLNVNVMAKQALKLADELGWRIDPAAKVRTLPVGTQQRVEILKALAGDADALIFDEPTAALSQDEIRDLFEALRSLRRKGKAIILIAHKLSEVLVVADRVTVLRKGRFVATAAVQDTNELELAEWMVGRLPAGLSRKPTEALLPGLEVERLEVFGDRGEIAVDHISLSIGRGEILGIGGVDGNGQIELAEALAGVRPYEGQIDFEGKEPVLAYIPQDRQKDGLALTMSVKDNLMIGRVGSGFLNRKALSLWAKGLADQYDVRVDSVEDPVGALSGGNQQKVVVARVLDSKPDVLVALNPTRGLDIRATEFVHRSILEARDRGAAVALFSTDLDELAALSTRTLFMNSGRLYDPSGASALVGGSE